MATHPSHLCLVARVCFAAVFLVVFLAFDWLLQPICVAGSYGCLTVLQVYVNNMNRTDVLLLIGAIYYQLSNYEQCIAFNDRCILLDPQMAEAHANLANALQQLGNFDMAIIYYQVMFSS